jgi:hypothetical protein
MSEATRIGALEVTQARHDVLLRNLDDDIRAFAPIVLEMAGVREQLRNVNESVVLCRNEVTKLRAEVDEERSERRKNRTLLWVAAVGLLGTFLTSTAVVLAAVI